MNKFKKILGTKFNIPTKTAWIVLIILMFLFSLYLIWLSLSQFWSFSSQVIWDLAIWNNAIYNTVKGYHFFATTIYHYPFLQNIFGEHTHFFMIFLLPFYIFYPRPETLLVLQTLALASGAIPLFLLGKKLLKNNLVSLGLSFLYLFFPYLGLINLSDFRVEIFCIPVLLWVIKFFEDNNFKWFLIFSFLAMSIQENIPLVILMFGLVAIIYRRNWKWILVPITLGVFFFVLDILITKFFQQNPHPVTAYNPWDQYNQYGNNFGEMFRFFVDNPKLVWADLVAPTKTIGLLKLFSPLSYLSLLAPQTLLPIIPEIIKNNLSLKDSMYPALIYYISPILPFLFWGLAKVVSWAKIYILQIIIVFLCIISSYIFYQKNIIPTFGKGQRTFSIDKEDHAIWETIKFIPHSARVAAHGDYSPKDLRYPVSFYGAKEIQRLDIAEIEKMDYVVFYKDLKELVDDPIVKNRIENILNDKRWEIVQQNDRLILMKKNKELSRK